MDVMMVVIGKRALDNRISLLVEA
ncbi:uncharacterized protein METZ01_LOCUS242057 [marine metagenome]|uniref:Uncharacterized protein n=1 Tax=marine metagenome TaxID=408172 RepID=A0A382HRG3_9ZZZZ